MKRFKLGPIRFDEKEMERDLGKDRYIFVGSSNDMFAHGIPLEWTSKVIKHTTQYQENRYLFQTKNPEQALRYRNDLPSIITMGTTIETNRDVYLSKAPPVLDRAMAIQKFGFIGCQTMITIEPIVDFDMKQMVTLIRVANPTWVNIGADSKGHNLVEPSLDKVQELIGKLNEFTEVRKKTNLARLTDAIWLTDAI